MKNKHIIVAMIVAPVLAVIAYFATDYTLSEKPEKAVAGQSYPLLAKSNCRYESGKCTLKNGQLELTLTATAEGGGHYTLHMQSDFPLRQATLALTEGKVENTPRDMTPVDKNRQAWELPIQPSNPSNDSLRLVVITENSSYFYVQTELVFLEEKTLFPRQQE